MTVFYSLTSGETRQRASKTPVRPDAGVKIAADIVMFLLLATVFIDFINGLIGVSAVGQGARIVLFALLMYIQLRLSVPSFLASLCLFVYCLGAWLFNGMADGGVGFSSFTYEVGMTIKLLLSFSIFSALTALHGHGFLTSETLEKLFLYSSYYAPILYLVSTLLGMGSYSYEGGIGYKSVFLSLNSVNITMVVLFVYSADLALNKRRMVGVVPLVLNLVALLMLGTKSSFVLVCGVFVFYLLIPRGIRLRNGLLILIVALVAYHVFSSVPELASYIDKFTSRQMYLYGERDLLDYLTSGRTWMFEAAVGIAGEESPLAVVLGGGYYGFHHKLALVSNYDNVVRPIEFDWADLFFSYGLVVSVVVYAFLIRRLSISWSGLANVDKRVVGYFYPLAVTVMLVYGSLGGHVLFEGISSTYLGLVLAGAAICGGAKAMPNVCDVIECCQRDLANNYDQGHRSFARRACLDLLVKLVLVSLNSFGPVKRTQVVFVDEINNVNMYCNLHASADASGDIDRKWLCFRKLSRDGHLRLGFFRPVVVILGSVLTALIASIHALLVRGESSDRLAVRYAIGLFLWLMGKRPQFDIAVCMTDHHFFSTVLAMDNRFTAVVLQHGLVQDIRYFCPVRADYLFAWGEASAELLGSDRVAVTGTDKYSGIISSRRPVLPRDARRVMLCLSSSKSAEQIRARLEPLLTLRERYGFALCVKVHPGSFFSIEEGRRAVDGLDVDVYKDERIEDIDFDFAVVEQSTAVLDFVCIGVSYIVVGTGAGAYFGGYEGIIPCAQNDEELMNLFEAYDMGLLRTGNAALLDRELNGGLSSVGDAIRLLASGEKIATGGGNA